MKCASLKDNSEKESLQTEDKAIETEPSKALPKIKNFLLPTWATILLCLAVAFLGQLFGSNSTSPLYEGWNFGTNQTDPGFFLYLGMAMCQGKKPYLEIYDQKGLFIYIFEWAGYAIAGKNGVFLLLCLSAFVTLLCLIYSARNLGSGLFGDIYIYLLYFILILCFKFGNHTGDIIMPYVALGFLVYTKAIKEQKEGYFFLGAFVAGIEAGVALCSRPTEAMWGLGFVIFYFVYWLTHKRNLNLLWNALLAIAGISIICGSMVFIAYNQGYLYEAINAVFTQGTAYLSNHNDLARTIDIVFTVLLFGAFIGISFFLKKKRGNDVFTFFLVVSIVSAIVNIGEARFPHYWLSAFPLIILLTYACLLPVDESTLSLKAKSIIKKIYIGFGGASLVVAAIWPSLYYIPQVPLAIMEGGEFSGSCTTNHQVAEDLDLIKNSPTFEEDKVLCLDCRATVYLYLGKVQPCKYAVYNTWWSDDRPEIATISAEYVASRDSDWVVVQQDKVAIQNEAIKKALNENYTLKSEDYYFRIYHLN